MLIYHRGITAACSQAAAVLDRQGIPLVDHPCPEVTHLLLDVPSFASDGGLRDGGSISGTLEMLPASTVVIGGNLTRPELHKHETLDLLKDPEYLARNAAITASCALEIAAPILGVTLPEAPVLIIGWGRIGKCLAKQLDGLGCSVTVAARNPSDRAMAAALGWSAADISEIPALLSGVRLLINTVPAPILGETVLNQAPKCVKLDLASLPGLSGKDVIYARGLPGRCAPESSGQLIAERILSHLRRTSI